MKQVKLFKNRDEWGFVKTAARWPGGCFVYQGLMYFLNLSQATLKSTFLSPQSKVTVPSLLILKVIFSANVSAFEGFTFTLNASSASL